uniref:Uncharacterized protein n=1 Tax=Oryza sativa subsp. japonica TaxID=39947 RepID=Q69MG3_ORYSJ|nr:hypothetical protein [Oryza sativa Japonica Group]BAD36330.1 hypothetical protein [Oryza sativa Japonica Group]
MTPAISSRKITTDGFAVVPSYFSLLAAKPSSPPFTAGNGDKFTGRPASAPSSTSSLTCGTHMIRP